MAKKIKTDRQLSILNQYFNKKQTKWPKKQIQLLSKQTKLSNNQVYKWLWDQRNVLNTYNNQIIQKQNPHNAQGQDGEGIYIDVMNGKLQGKNQKQLLIKGFSLEASLKIDDNLIFAHQYYVSKQTSQWAIDLLQKYGGELAKINHKQEKISLDCNKIRQFKQTIETNKLKIQKQ